MEPKSNKVCVRCGEEKPLSEYHSNCRGGLRGHCKTCHKKESTYYWNGLTDAEYLFRMAKNRASRNGREFTISLEDVEAVDTDFCAVLKIPIHRYDHVPNTSNKVNAENDSKSLDRIDPTKGYIPGNIRVISTRANKLLSNMTAEEATLIYRSFYPLTYNES